MWFALAFVAELVQCSAWLFVGEFFYYCFVSFVAILTVCADVTDYIDDNDCHNDCHNDRTNDFNYDDHHAADNDDDCSERRLVADGDAVNRDRSDVDASGRHDDDADHIRVFHD